ncbi:hypothetical protein [Desulfovibrio sp.]|uniref:hypothetical protein n=1 Tax=Desulfovibrio sp. TaxID=885 RepID=UPI003D0E69B9
MDYATPIGQEAQGEAAIYIDGNPEAGIEGSAVPAKAIESPQREIIHAIKSAGLTPSGTDLTQLTQAIVALATGVLPGIATSENLGLVMPDGITITVDEAGRISLGTQLATCSTAAATAAKTVSVSNFSLAAGRTINVLFTSVNTAANPTLNVSGTGAKPITCYGIPVEVGALAQGQVYTLIYSGSQWQIIGGMAPYPIGQYVWFEDELVRPGFYPANANIITGFAAKFPQMAAYLSTTHGASRCFSSLAQYESAHNAVWATLADGSTVSWNNIGGVAKFWWDKAADTLLMPDLTEMTRFMSGASLGVGDAQGDVIRNIKGTVSNAGDTGITYASGSAGAFKTGAALPRVLIGNNGGGHVIELDPSCVVPTGSANAPRRWGALACAYMGQPAL